MKSKRNRTAPRSLMQAGALCCRDLSMRTRIWFLQEIGSMILNGMHVARLMSKSPKLAAEFGPRLRRRARPVSTIFLWRQRNARIGFYAAGQQLLRANPATG